MSERILVVEDDPLNSMLLCDALEGAGFSTKPVTDGGHVLTAATAFRPHLITMDINLPTISGVDLIRALKTKLTLRQIPILAITAYAGREEEGYIRSAGAADYLVKPVSIEQLLGHVHELLHHRDRVG